MIEITKQRSITDFIDWISVAKAKQNTSKQIKGLFKK